ncbi:MAG: hypothetical protein JO101_03350, partial [Candidatus Eremiobacteraeota bacterium]|nr:hypothetical protein [Candidatus Eremiobacteraeota bacterium]
ARPAYVMEVEVYGMGSSMEASEQDLARRFQDALRLSRTAGVPVIEIEPTAKPCPQGCAPVDRRTFIVRDSDGTRLTRLFLELQRADAIASVPRFALLPRDAVLALVCASMLLGFATFERGRWSRGLPVAHRIPLLLAFVASGLLTWAALIADSREMLAHAVPLALVALALPLWSLSESSQQLPARGRMRSAFVLAGLILATPIPVWCMRYFTLGAA